MGRGAKWRFGELCAGIKSEWIKSAARLKDNAGSWTRERKLTLADMIFSILGRKALSAAMEVWQYFQAVGKTEKKVSKQDYLKRRKQLNPEVFKRLNGDYLRNFYNSGEAKKWRGYLVFAVDGSRMEVPNSRENQETYGKGTNQHGDQVARANLSGMYDVFNRFFVDIGIYSYHAWEADEAKAHLEAMKGITGREPAVILFDRNYGSLEFINFLEESGVKYLIRLRGRNYREEREGMISGDEEVELVHSKHRLRAYRKQDRAGVEKLKQQRSTRARIIKARFGGEEGAFITNLSKEIGPEAIKKLYRERWEIEKKFHTLKNKMKTESVTGKASLYVKQDFWASVLVYNMVQDLLQDAEKKAGKNAKIKGFKYKVRINENIAIGLFKERFISLTLEDNGDRRELLLKQLEHDMEQNIVPVRALKAAPRKWNRVNKNKCNLKPSY